MLHQGGDGLHRNRCGFGVGVSDVFLVADAKLPLACGHQANAGAVVAGFDELHLQAGLLVIILGLGDVHPSVIRVRHVIQHHRDVFQRLGATFFSPRSLPKPIQQPT